MPAERPLDCHDALAELARAQAGVVSRRQALELGLTNSRVRHLVGTGAWRRFLPGVYVVFTGPISYLTRSWAAVLYAGSGAALALETAAHVWGLQDEAPEVVHVMVPGDRRVSPQPGVRIHLRIALRARTHPARTPPTTRVEDTVLDLVERAGRAQDVVGLVTSACQRRRTTARRIAVAMAARKKMRWRSLVADVLEDVRDGVLSALERMWRRDVEQAHGLPAGERNARERNSGATRYRDVRYLALRIVVELDGRAAHPDEERHRDMRRDNAVAETGAVTLRYGWDDIAARPCAVAAQFARVARQRGWRGRPRRCGPSCHIDAAPPS